MNTTTLVMLAVTAVLVVFYMARRRNRLARKTSARLHGRRAAIALAATLLPGARYSIAQPAAILR